MKIIDNCSRCGGAHDGLELKQLARAFAPPEAGGLTWTHWTTCPTTGDPILVIVGPNGVDSTPDETPIPGGTQAFEEVLEWCYWRFDSLRGGTELAPDRKDLGPMAERDAFKSVMRALFYAKWRLDGQLAELVSRCPLGYVDGKIIATKSTDDAVVIAWLQELDQLLGIRRAAKDHH